MSKITLPHSILVVVLAACAAGSEPAEPPAGEAQTRQLELVPERAPAEGEALWLEVHVGALPAAASLVVRDASGAMIGAVSPYGKSVREQGGSHLLSLPGALQTGDRVQLRVELVEPRGGVRPPTDDELTDVRLVYVPVSTTDESPPAPEG